MRFAVLLAMLISMQFMARSSYAAGIFLSEINADGWYTGYVIGKPISIRPSGFIFQRTLVQLKVGEFAEDPSFVGSNYSMTIDESRTDLIKKFEEIRGSDKNYVFKFRTYYILNPGVIPYPVRDFITEIIDPAEVAGKETGPSVAQSSAEPSGWNNGGEHTGRITAVERWGFLSPVCAVEVNFSGIQAGEKSDTHGEYYAVYNEQACQSLEKILFYQIPVNVESSHRILALWSFYDNVAHKISVAPLKSPTGIAPSNLTTLRDQLEDALLKDPKFIEELRSRLNQK